MTKQEAWLYAAQWGSYMRDGDPGACMYGFDEHFKVQSEAHRADCLRWIDNKCIPQAQNRPHDFNNDELEQLAALREAIVNAEVS